MNYKDLNPNKIITTPGGTLTQVIGDEDHANLSVALVKMDELSKGLKHYHDNIKEVYLFTEGKGKIIINENENIIDGPVIYIIDAKNVHYIESITEMNFCCICTPPWTEQHEFVSNEYNLKENITETKEIGPITDNITIYDIKEEFHINTKEPRIYYILEGTGTLKINDKEYEIKLNDCYYLTDESEIIIPSSNLKFALVTNLGV